MVNKKAIILGFLVFILSITAYLAVSNYEVDFLTIVQEPGWLPFAELADQFTNLSSDGTSTFSQYWYANRAVPLGYPKDSGQEGDIEGGDARIIISANRGDSSSGYEPTYKFNLNLYKKYFAVDYRMDMVSSAGSESGGGLSVMGYSISGGQGVTGRIEIRPNILDNTRADVYINGIKIKTVNATDEQIYVTGSVFTCVASSAYACQNRITFTNPRWKPLFDCYVDNDEVVIFDEFAPESSFKITDLTYPVQKFCLNQPAVIRSFTDRGIAVDTDAQIFSTLAEGGIVNVPVNQSIRIPYITKIQAGILRCPASEAWNTITQECEVILSEGEPDLQGTKVVVIEIGESGVIYNQDYTSPSLQVGDTEIVLSAPQYTCPCDTSFSGYYYPPLPTSNCWASTINGVSRNYGDIFNVTDFVTGEYTISGVGVYHGEKDGNLYNCIYRENSDWVNHLKLNIDRDNGFKITAAERINHTGLNENVSVSIQIYNGIANFVNSGVLKRTYYKIIDSTIITSEQIAFTTGNNVYDLQVPTDKLGDVVVEVKPYIEILGKRIYSNSRAIFNYRVGINDTTTIYLNFTEYVDRYHNRNVTCMDVNCPTGYDCSNSTGLCVKTEFFGCNVKGCPTGFACDTNLDICKELKQGIFSRFWNWLKSVFTW